jgi:hypothetical protein
LHFHHRGDAVKPWFALLALCGLAAPLWPEGNGSGQILLIEPSAQAGALGGAVVCAEGLEGMDANPAGLGWLDRSEFSATHLAWVQGFTYEDMAVAMPLAVGALGLHGDIFSSPQVQQTDVNDQVLGSYSEQDLDLGLAYGLRLGPVSGGLQLRYLRDSMLDLVRNGFSTDLGAEWRLPRGVVLGASLQNMGLMEGLGAESTQVPLVWRGAGSWEGLVAGIATRAEAGLYHLDGDTPEIRTGVEAGVEQTIFFRLGYCLSWTGDETRSYSVGAGIFLWGMHMDYAFVPMGVLGQTHRITLSSAFGDLPGLRPEEETHAINAPLNVQMKPVDAFSIPASWSNFNMPLSVQARPEASLLEVSWAVPEGAPGLVGYHLWLRKGAEPSLHLVSEAPVKGLNALLRGLDPAQEYGVAVSAVDRTGKDGHLSPEVKAQAMSANIALYPAYGGLPGFRPAEDTHANNGPLSLQVRPVDAFCVPAGWSTASGSLSMQVKPETGLLEVSWASQEGAPAEVLGYHLWMRKGAEPALRMVAAAPVKGMRVLLRGLDPSLEYGVAVSAVDGKGMDGHLSSEVRAQPLAVNALAKAAPAAPHGLRAQRAWGQVVLSWYPSADKDVDGYECFLRRHGKGQPWERLGMVGADVSHLAVDRDKVPRDVEAFVVRAVRRVGHGFQAGLPSEEAGVPQSGLW